MNDYRCPVCRRLLFKGEIIKVQVKCPKCRRVVMLVSQKSSATGRDVK